MVEENTGVAEKIVAGSFEILYKTWKDLSLKEMYKRAMVFLKSNTGMEPPETDTDDYTDRDYIEVTIATLSFIHCLVYGIDYPNFDDNVEEFNKLESKNKILKYLISLKFELFGKEIFEDLGLEIVGKKGDQYLIKDKNNYS